MNIRTVIVFVAMFHCSISYGVVRGRSFFSPRSTSTNAPRDLAGWQEYINQYSPEEPNYGAVQATLEFMHSFDASRLANYFFNTDMLVFSGSRVAARGANDILADYFGLPTDFRSVLFVTPTVSTALLDLHWYASLSSWRDDVYLRIHAPIVYTRWSPGLCESNIDEGSLSYPAGYMADELITRQKLVPNVTTALQGCCAFGDYQPLRFGKFECARSLVALSDIQIALGWNMINRPDHHVGLLLRVAAPTAPGSKAVYFFEPTIGNGAHWELGFGFTGHTMIWENNEATKSWAFYADLNMMHLFGSRQRRSYDLKTAGPLSRYVLIQAMGSPVVEGFAVAATSSSDPVDATIEYRGAIMPAINQTSLCADISIAVQADLVAKFTYVRNRWSFDLGYNLWGRTGESLQCRDAFPANAFAIKGDAQVYGFVDPFEPLANTAIPLNATQSSATIHAGQGEGNANLIFNNHNADTVDLASSSPATVQGQVINQTKLPLTDTGLVDADIEPVSGSPMPILLTDCDIDNLSGLAPSAFTQKIFFNARYACDTTHAVIPFVGLGVEVELDGGGAQKVDALSQWGVWLKAGISY